MWPLSVITFFEVWTDIIITTVLGGNFTQKSATCEVWPLGWGRHRQVLFCLVNQDSSSSDKSLACGNKCDLYYDLYL